MIITTTPAIEGKKITEYKGIVFGEFIAGLNVLKDITVGIKSVLGKQSSSYEDDIQEARKQAIDHLAARAEEMGANAVIGVDVDYAILGTANNMLMVTATGTAVVTESM